MEFYLFMFYIHIYLTVIMVQEYHGYYLILLRTEHFSQYYTLFLVFDINNKINQQTL